MASAAVLDQEKEQRDENKNSGIQDIQEMFSTLPKVRAWGGDSDYYQYQGFWYPQMFLEGVIWSQQSFRARETDIYLATFPKCGTTWLKALMSTIQNRNNQSQSNHSLLTNNPHECVPFLELLAHKENPNAYVESLPSPRLLATHISYSSLPDSIVKTSGTRIVCIARNPKDVLVSLWEFTQKIRRKTSNGKLETLPLEEAFDMFCKGPSVAGPFWDHVLGYWEASKENPDKVLFLKYEDMKKDAEECVKRLAQFMRQPFSLEEEKLGVVQEVMSFCSFENLSNLEVNKSGAVNLTSTKALDNDIFFRKGQVGDSKNHLTSEMLEQLDKITEQKLEAAGLKL
ncbi:flavonol 3-sulfotransferase-like [Argentina anserina]|uniref:flavonol 3-sulfotransferase-like n=1 Tax=Argentina anserina TaxID=57926 RepID=UPI00217630E2|nr:flavonol 3-sulfotransferase-like [Potentilla anserina]